MGIKQTIKKILKKIVTPFARLGKRLCRPFTSRIRHWFIGAVREAIGPNSNESRGHLSKMSVQFPYTEEGIRELWKQFQEQSTIGQLETLLLAILAKENAGKSGGPIPFGIPVSPELMFTKHPIVGYYFASTKELPRLAMILLQEYQVFLSHFFLHYKKKGITILDLDPADGYHTLSLATNISSDSTILVPNNFFMELNFQYHSLSESLRLLDNSTRDGLIGQAFSQSSIDLILLNSSDNLVGDLQRIANMNSSAFPTIIFEYSPKNFSQIKPILSEIRSRSSDYKLYEISRSSLLILIPDLETIDKTSHVVLTRKGER